ncbi:GAF domain-containing protein [Geodermatophilus nigrescens]|uniref:GAF domain-containing protein n=1 Tax=Geodermatophilus nigrescens TaxID=1070870 RepID=A0A1M5F1D6_9ACTN|nr:GAF domain-containing protein [Geodermatophilus nigrescens]SHF85208.1 GAF domain-containing protein [Geodermatophilus nigrescens]
MNGDDPRLRRMWSQVAGVVESSATVQERAAEHLRRLGRTLAFDVGWLAVRDPERRTHVPLATTGPAEALVAYFRRPEADDEVDALGLNRHRPPLLATELPSPLPELRAWAEHLLPAGFRQGLAAPLVTMGGRHIGFLSLLSDDPSRLRGADRRLVAAVTRVIADDLDRTRDVAETARIVGDAGAGVVLTRGGDVLPLPGLPDDRLLTPGSPVFGVAAAELAVSGAFTSFLAPVPGNGTERLVRVTALDLARPDLDHLSAAVLLSAPGDLHGLTVLDLRVLGLVTEGVTGVPALARALHVAAEAVADSLGRSLVALGTGDLTAAAVRALRGGLRIPPRVTGPL